MRKTLSYIFLIIVLTAFQACTERFYPPTETFEDLMVVEATLTDELKHHQVSLTRTYRFEEVESQPPVVDNAEVVISDDLGNEYVFEYDAAKRTYVSLTEFQALPNREYKLDITTGNGHKFTSTPQTLPTANSVEVTAERKEVDGEVGVQIQVDSYDPTNSSQFYRYEYSETYKVVAPMWYSLEVYLDPTGSTPEETFKVRPRDTSTQVCYSTNVSDNIILTTTSDLSEDRVADFPVRFISQNDYTISSQYSILVTQYVENYDTYLYYKTLKEVSGSEREEVLSPTQPGYIIGNINSVENPDTKILGRFDVSSVSSQRIFFEYEDFFPGEPLPPYFYECEEIEINIYDPPGEFGIDPKDVLTGMINTKSHLLYQYSPPNIFVMVAPECTDCTTYSSNIKPDFWP